MGKCINMKMRVELITVCPGKLLAKMNTFYNRWQRGTKKLPESLEMGGSICMQTKYSQNKLWCQQGSGTVMPTRFRIFYSNKAFTRWGPAIILIFKTCHLTEIKKKQCSFSFSYINYIIGTFIYSTNIVEVPDNKFCQMQIVIVHRNLSEPRSKQK